MDQMDQMDQIDESIRRRLRLASRASFLHERPVNRRPLPASRLEHAETLLRLWREGTLAEDSLFAERVQDAGVSREALLAMLADEHEEGEPSESDAPWLALFDEIACPHPEGEPPSPAGPGGASSVNAAPFTRFADPFVEVGRARLRAALASDQRGSASPPGSPVEGMLLRHLRGALSFVAIRTLVLELNVARLRGQLLGDTPEARLEHFSAHHLGDRSMREGLLHEYPVLARLMTTIVDRWLQTTLELVRRLAEDRPAIERLFSGGTQIGDLTAVHLGLSDPHRGGRTVAVLAFSSGLKLVYKPKSLAVDVAFQGLLAWLNTIGLRFDQRALTVLDRSDYGWVEFVEHTSCDDIEAVRRFYVRQGGLLALLHVLRATDMHFENLIAAGEHPVLIDLETLFHHSRASATSPSPGERAMMALKESVFFVGLLPVFALERGPAAGVDFSALGGRPGQSFPHPMPALEDAHRDTMRFVQKRVTTVGASNRPRLCDGPVEAAAHVEAIVLGFVETYRRLAEERAALAAQIDAFAEVEVRHIVRPTFQYAFVLNAALHPDFLRDGLGRERALNHLWVSVAAQPALRAMVPFERVDLLGGDIPLFTARPGGRDLWSSHGERVPNFFPRASLDACKERLSLMDEQGCAAQVKLLRMSLRSLQ
jgi:type 2 lantibiotic biosynthesis protein LanM